MKNEEENMRSKRTNKFTGNCLYALLLVISFPTAITSCSHRQDIPPELYLPIDETNQLTFKVAFDLETEPDGRGQQEIYKLWNISAFPTNANTSQLIELACSNERIVDNAYWLPAGNKQFNEALQFSEKFADYPKVASHLNDMLRDPSLKIRYRYLFKSSGQIKEISYWICSPASHKIALIQP